MDKKEFLAAKERIKAEVQKIQAGLKDVFHGGAKQFFRDNPEITSFAWTAYTPYFNDGDECVFSSHHEDSSSMDINGKSDDDFEYKSKEYVERYKLAKIACKFVSQFDDDDIKSMFGDHVKITVTPNGIETENYSHD